ncbi:MAG: HEAT repeat domain-containing protein [Myxococcaceae bacterium]
MNAGVFDAEADARYRALDALPPGPGSLELLLVGLHDTNWRVRRLAADRVAALKPTPETVDHLVSMLGRRDDTGARNAAAAVLAQLGPASLEPLVALLRHPDPDQRKFAADILGELRRTEAVEALVTAVADADANVRTSAAEALGRVGGPDARRALERLLGSSDVMLRVCALEGLAHLGLPVPLPALVPLLADPLTRRSAWRLLGHVHHPTALLLTVRGLAARESRDAALVAIGAAGRQLGTEWENDVKIVLSNVRDLYTWLESALASSEADRRLGALTVAAALSDARLALAVVRSVHGGADAEWALDALLRMGLAGAHALLASPETLADLPGEARAVASDALVRLAEPALCGALVALLDSGDPELAELGARALGKTRSREAIEPLVRLFDDDMLAVHAWHSLVLLSHSWPDAVREALQPLVKGKLRPHVVRAWAEIVGPRAHDVIKRALHDASEPLRAAATEASLHTPRETGAVLQSSIIDESPMVRRAAARTLSRLPVVEAQPLLARALQDEDDTVLAVACTAAGQLGVRDAVDRLDALSRHISAAVAVAALEGLALMGRLSDELLMRATAHSDPELLKLALSLGADRAVLIPRAVPALEHSRWDVRVAAARLLAVAAGREAVSPLQDAVARETDDVARALLDEALQSLLRRV